MEENIAELEIENSGPENDVIVEQQNQRDDIMFFWEQFRYTLEIAFEFLICM